MHFLVQLKRLLNFNTANKTTLLQHELAEAKQRHRLDILQLQSLLNSTEKQLDALELENESLRKRLYRSEQKLARTTSKMNNWKERSLSYRSRLTRGY